jgi:hypothetical protein
MNCSRAGDGIQREAALLLEDVLDQEDSGMHRVATRCSTGGHILNDKYELDGGEVA